MMSQMYQLTNGVSNGIAKSSVTHSQDEPHHEPNNTKSGSLASICKPPKKRYLEDMSISNSNNNCFKVPKTEAPTAKPKKNGIVASEDQPLNLSVEKEKTITGCQGKLISRMVDKFFSSEPKGQKTLLDSFLHNMTTAQRGPPATAPPLLTNFPSHIEEHIPKKKGASRRSPTSKSKKINNNNHPNKDTNSYLVNNSNHHQQHSGGGGKPPSTELLYSRARQSSSSPDADSRQSNSNSPSPPKSLEFLQKGKHLGLPGIKQGSEPN